MNSLFYTKYHPLSIEKRILQPHMHVARDAMFFDRINVLNSQLDFYIKLIEPLHYNPILLVLQELRAYPSGPTNK